MWKSNLLIIFTLIFNFLHGQPLEEGVKIKHFEKPYLYEYNNGKISYFTEDSVRIFEESFEIVSDIDENEYVWAIDGEEIYIINVLEKKKIHIPLELHFLVNYKFKSIRSQITKNIYFPLREGFFMDIDGQLITTGVFETYYKQKSTLQNEFQAYLSDIEIEEQSEEEKNRIQTILKYSKFKEMWITEPGFYDEILLLDDMGVVENFFLVKRNRKWGVISSTGDLILPCEYSEIELVYQEVNGYFKYYYLTKKGKLGLYSATGENLIPCEYDDIQVEDYSYYSNGHMQGFTVEQKNKLGFYLTDGTQLIPCKYKYVDSYFINYDKTKSINSLPKTDKEKLTCDFYPYSFYGIGIGKKREFDFYSPQGDFLNQIEVDDFYETSELGYITFEKNGKMGLIGKSACLKIPATKFFITLYEKSNDLLIFCDEELENGEFKVELLDENLKPYFEKDLQISSFFMDQLVAIENGKYGLVSLKESTRSKIVWSFEPEYDLIYSISTGILKVQKNDKFGLVDRKNKKIVPIEYQSIKLLENRSFSIQKEDHFLLFDSYGKQLTTHKFDSISIEISRATIDKSTLYVVFENGKWQFFDIAENSLIEGIIADKIEKNNSQSFKVTKNGLQMIIDLNLETVIPLKYRSITMDFGKYRYECVLENGKKEYYDYSFKKQK